MDSAPRRITGLQHPVSRFVEHFHCHHAHERLVFDDQHRFLPAGGSGSGAATAGWA